MLATFFVVTLGAWSASAATAASRPQRPNTALGFSCTITGTPGNDVLTGTSGDDTICGLNGNDTIRGLGGNDTLVGGDGNDTLLPGPDNDDVIGDAGTNTVAYSDITSGGVTVSLGAGTATGSQAGSDTLSGIQNANGTDQADTITGDGNANLLNGLGGNDSLSGAGGNDNLAPGLGNDPVVNGGSGDDYVNYSAITGGGVVVNLTTGTATGAGGTDTLTSIEWAIGSNQGDTLRGDAGDNILKGLAGDDQLFGNNGNDTLLPNGGTDTVNGGNGGDWVSYSDVSGGAVTVDLGAGSATEPSGTDTLSFVEKVIGTNQNDSLTGDNGPNTLNGLAGNDSLFGLGGVDTLVPGTGDDPTVHGGAGLDYVSYGDLTGGGVTVDLTAQTASGPTAGTDTLTAIDNVTGSNQADTITGNTGPNIVYGLGGADTITVGEGNNTVFGGDGDDLVTAGTGNDTIDGGNNDTGNPGDQCFADGGTNTVTNCETTNRPPVAFDDPALGQEASFTTNENTAFNTGDVTANDTDPDFDALTVNTLDVTGTQGLVTQNPDNKTFHYDPNGLFESLQVGQTATTTFKYTDTDGQATSNEATVTITINGVNDPPTAVDDTGNATNEDTVLNLDPRTNDTDPDAGDTKTVTAVGTPDNGGSAAVTGGGTGVSFTPGASFQDLQVGQSRDSNFTYTIQDSQGATDTATVTVTVTGVNDNPVGVNDSFSGAIGNTELDVSNAGTGGPAKSLTGNVLSNDTDVDNANNTLTASGSGASTNGGSFTMSSDGSFQYFPPAGFTGADTFTYTVSDPNGGSGTGTVTVNVSAPLVWYIDTSFGGGGNNGTSTKPFTSLTPINTGGGSDSLDGNGDVIFVYQGTYSSAIALEQNQKLWGQPNGLVVNSTTLVSAGGTAPVLNAAVTLNSGNDLEGLALGTVSGGTSLSGSAGGTNTAGATTAVSINNGSGQAVSISNGTLAMTFSSVTSSGSSGAGIALTNVGGSFTASGGSISTAAGNDVDIDQGNASFSYAGSISNTAGRAVEVTNHTGGTIAFSGAITDSGGTGISLVSNGGTTMNFTSGSLNLSTGAGSQAFTATGGGTVNVTGSNNVLVTTTGAALDIENTTIGGSNVTFKSISAGPASFTGSPTSGLILNNTGTSGSFTVAGTGSAGTGGTIKNTSGDGVALTTVQNVGLNWMSVTSNKGNGVHGSGVTGLTLANTTVSSNGDDSGAEDGVLVQNLLGTNSITNVNVSGSARHNIGIINSSGTLTSLSITGSSIHDNSATGSNGLTVIADGTATMNGVSISTTNFTSNHTAGIQAQTLNGGSLTLTATGGTYSNNFNAVDFDHASNTTGTLTTTFTGATITNGATGCAGTLPCGAPINLFLGSQSSSNAASIFRATVTSNTVNNGGSSSAPGIWFHTGNPVRGHARLLITGNNVSGVNNIGIDVEGGGCISPQICDNTVDSTIQNNTVVVTDLYGIQVNDGTNTADTQIWCADISSNTATGAIFNIRTRHRQSTGLKLPGYGGAQYDTAAVISYLAGRNPASAGGTGISATTSSLGPGYSNAGASCLTP